MDFLLLGPLAAYRNGHAVELGTRRRERCLLGVLLLEPGRLFSVDRLVELLWDEEPPAQARSTVSNHISRLRSRLDPDRTGHHGVRLVARGGGYLIEVVPDRVDVHRFTSLVERAGALAVPADRSRLLREALALWRGSLLADVATDRLRRRVGARLEELRLTAVEDALQADLACGRPALAAAELADLVEAHPDRERLLWLFMLALYRLGRQSEALAAYRQARERVADELGLDLGADVQALHEAILRCDPSLDLATGDSTAVVPARPAQLPAPPRHFVGRTAAMRELDALLARQAEMTTVVISTMAGVAGVGKTALALHWAARVRDRFADGQLYLNLRGFGVMAPVRPADALNQLLRGLGVPAERIPADQDEASAVYRTLLADRRVLVLLDNAHSVDQVRALLPGSPTCLVVVTSRNRLSGLVAIEGAHRLTIEPLPPDEAVVLLRAVLGARVDAEPEAVSALAQACDRLPLALRIAAANLSDDPSRAIGDYLRELDTDRLAALHVEGDRDAAVRVALDASYARLTPEARRLFRLLSLAPGADIGEPAARALLGSTAQHLLESLVDAHLVDEHRPGRYTMHDLIRVYAGVRAEADEPAGDRTVAVERLLDWCLAGAHVAYHLIRPNRAQPEPALRHPPAELPFAPEAEAALAFLDQERPNLPAVTELALRHGDHPAAMQLARLLSSYFQLRGDGPDSLAVYQHGLAGARHLHDRAAEAALHNSLGISYAVGRRFPEATEHVLRSLALARDAGDRASEAGALNNLGRMYEVHGRFEEALGAYEQSLAVREAEGRTQGIAYVLNNIGFVYARRGELTNALDYLTRALALHREQGDRNGEGNTLDSVGVVYLEQGDDATALKYFEEAMAALRDGGNREGQGATLANMATAHLRQGEPAAAVDVLRQAAVLYRAVDDRHRESAVRRRLAEAYLAGGDVQAAEAELRAASALRASVPDAVEEAEVRRVLGELESARAAGVIRMS